MSIGQEFYTSQTDPPLLWSWQTGPHKFKREEKQKKRRSEGENVCLIGLCFNAFQLEKPELSKKQEDLGSKCALYFFPQKIICHL